MTKLQNEDEAGVNSSRLYRWVRDTYEKSKLVGMSEQSPLYPQPI